MKISLKHDFSNSKIQTDTIDESAFKEAIDKILSVEKGSRGIGTLSEKGVHATLKYYYVPYCMYHEVKIGNYVADAVCDGEVYEIQSKGFHLLRGKLDLFLEEHDVTVIYPVYVQKYLRYVDRETGEISKQKKSSKKMTLYDVVPELYRIKQYLSNKHLHFIISFLEIEEYKFKQEDGKRSRKGNDKIDRIPIRILGEFRIDSKVDYLKFLPENKAFPEKFTTKDIEAYTGHDVKYAQVLVNILISLELIEKIGMSGRCILYKKTQNNKRNKRSKV